MDKARQEQVRFWATKYLRDDAQSDVLELMSDLEKAEARIKHLEDTLQTQHAADANAIKQLQASCERRGARIAELERPSVETVLSLLEYTKRRAEESKPNYLERTTELCNQWGPVILYWAEEEVRTQKAKVAALEESRRWISVGERPPEEAGYYIACFRSGSEICVHQLYWSAVQRKWFQQHAEGESIIAVSQWQPLPPSPIQTESGAEEQAQEEAKCQS